MARSSITGGERAPQQAKGRDTDTLGPSDTSDSGSDIQGASRLKTDAEEGQLGGAIALGHPLGASGARLVTTAVSQLHRSGGRYALCTMCIGVGQGIALIVERV